MPGRGCRNRHRPKTARAEERGREPNRPATGRSPRNTRKREQQRDESQAAESNVTGAEGGEANSARSGHQRATPRAAPAAHNPRSAADARTPQTQRSTSAKTTQDPKAQQQRAKKQAQGGGMGERGQLETERRTRTAKTAGTRAPRKTAERRPGTGIRGWTRKEPRGARRNTQGAAGKNAAHAGGKSAAEPNETVQPPGQRHAARLSARRREARTPVPAHKTRAEQARTAHQRAAGGGRVHRQNVRWAGPTDEKTPPRPGPHGAGPRHGSDGKAWPSEPCGGGGRDGGQHQADSAGTAGRSGPGRMCRGRGEPARRKNKPADQNRGGPPTPARGGPPFRWGERGSGGTGQPRKPTADSPAPKGRRRPKSSRFAERNQRRSGQNPPGQRRREIIRGAGWSNLTQVQTLTARARAALNGKP